MRVYVAQTRSAELVRRLWRLGFGECTVRGELPPRRHPWFYDNGAYSDWTAGRPFDSAQFLADVESIYLAIDRTEWIVLPDLVAQGGDSLAFSLSWLHRLRGLAPLYLAVQDGMEPADIEPLLSRFAGLFVGGSLGWKVRTGEAWARLAHEHERRCHIGRCGSIKRVRWAQRIGADSIDSALPLWSDANLDRFLAALEPRRQAELFARAA